MKTYIATVNILIEAENESEACDSISACLTENLQHNGAIIDWSYSQNKDNDFALPVPYKDIVIAEYSEGDFTESLAPVKLQKYPESYRTELENANSLLRSAHSIAIRQGDSTYWIGFIKQLEPALERQQKMLNQRDFSN